MGHQFARSVVAAAVAVSAVAACGGDDDVSTQTPVLDNAREQVASATQPPDLDDSPADATAGEAFGLEELPAPDPSEYDGANRVVNLWVGPDGETRVIDVWGRRTFTNGPILLAENLAFAQASDYFSAPPGYSLAVVGAGAGPDGEELAGMFNADADDQVTMIFTNDDEDGTVWAPNLWEKTAAATGLAPDPPSPGSGVVFLYAPNTRSFDETLTTAIGGSSFYVGNGSPECARQRIEDQGYQANVLGGTQDVQLEVAPGPVAISLHPWFSPDGCDQAAALEFTVDVPADGIVTVLVYSPDGTTIDTLQLSVQ